MSGHSKWHSIRHKKGANDAARGKVFTRHGKLITIAARDGGGDPDMNPGLRLAIENAKKENMPNTNIERAIKKGTGEDKDGAILEEIAFEGYGVEGIAVYVKTITDNRNRTVASVRSAFSKNGGNLGSSGSVAFMFHNKGLIEIKNPSEDLEMVAIENNADDIKEENGTAEVICDPKEFTVLKKALEEAGADIYHAEVTMIPETTVRIEDEGKAKQIMKLVSALEDDDDVSSVHANFDIPEEILEKIA
ncbi:MAG: YebC/PmpR family DNA-binding transcriptional regulator [Candidatus Gracilibacteria bacterium]|jgi:YebC/PmpR family DNA-binding regulatory protein|nr:YebC/PmpR family DNA-binding transcriptional regulator [Candidatus Gracilibacteria bacterium]